MANSKFRCKGCKEYYPAQQRIKIPAGSFHSFDCATQHGRNAAIKKVEQARKKKHRELKEKVKDNDRSHWRKKAQASFNKFIRLRDHSQGCISCRKPFNSKYDAGHYRSTGAHPELRFSELNNNGQCVHCNQHLSGNLIDYRIGLIDKIGLDKVEWLEGPHKPKRYTIEELKEIHKKYAKLNKELEQC